MARGRDSAQHVTLRSSKNHVRAGSDVGGVGDARRANAQDLVALVNSRATPPGHTPMSVAKILARESAEQSGRAVVQLSVPSVDLFAAEAPAELRQGDALPGVPTWIELIPAPFSGADNGHVETRDSRAGFILDAQAIVDEFNAKPEAWRAAPIDWEHKGHRNWHSERCPAAAWIEELKVGDDGASVWGRVDWTPEGRDDVQYKRYRYISPVVAIVWPGDSEGNIDWDAVPIARALIDAALTNNPATYIRDLARTPIEGSDDDMQNSRAGALAASIAPEQSPSVGRPKAGKMQLSKEALNMLGLPEDATAEQVEQALLTLRTAPAQETQRDSNPEPAQADQTQTLSAATIASIVQAAIEPLTKKVESLEGEKAATNAEILASAVNSAVDSAIAGFKATPAMREGLVKFGMSVGADELRKHIDSLPSLAHLSAESGKGQIGQPANDPGQLTATEIQVADKLGMSPDAMRKAKQVMSRDGGRFGAGFISLTTAPKDDEQAA